MEKLKNLPISLAIIIAGIIIAAVIFALGFSEGGFGKKGYLGSKEAGETAMKFLNENLLAQAPQKGEFKEIVDAGQIYKITFNLNGKEEYGYMTKDAKIFMPMAIDMKEQAENGDNTEETPAGVSKCEDVKKADVALLEPFIVSQCPYGLQMQRAIAEMIKNAPQLSANVKVRYIGSIEDGKITAMHGDKEAAENLNQICIREEMPEKYWGYVGCYMKDGNSATCLKSAGVDTARLNACAKDANRGLKYAKVDFDIADAKGVTGSPTLFVNGELADESGFGGRTADSVKSMICCGSNNQPGACSKALATDSAAVGFSAEYKSTNNNAGAGNCDTQ